MAISNPMTIDDAWDKDAKPNAPESCESVNVDGLKCFRNAGHRDGHAHWIDGNTRFEWDDEHARQVHADRASILDEAASIVAGARAAEYGEGAENSLPRIAAYWSTYLGRELSARDAANMMVLLKMARESHKAKRDNHVDAIGYLALAEQCDGSQP